MTLSEVLTSLRVIALDLHVGVTKTNNLLLTARARQHDKLLLAVSRLTLSDSTRGVCLGRYALALCHN